MVGGQSPKAIRGVECYDFESERWCPLAEMPTRRCRAGLAVVCGRVYAVGGFNGSLRVRTVDLYEPNLDQWFPAPEMDSRRSTLGVAVLNNCIYAVSFVYKIDIFNKGVLIIVLFHRWEDLTDLLD